jgi:uncharacterized protein with von Willebrand factor type A (vWA) domain
MLKVRSFAFSSDLAEVTELFERNKIERDCGAARQWRFHRHGQAFVDFKKTVSTTSTTTTIIILGDARNNYGDPRTEIDCCKRLIWLDPNRAIAGPSATPEMRAIPRTATRSRNATSCTER